MAWAHANAGWLKMSDWKWLARSCFMLLGNDVHTACYYLASIFDDLSILHCTFSFPQLHDMNALTVAAAACKCTMQHKAFGSETQAAPMQIELEVRTQNEALATSELSQSTNPSR